MEICALKETIEHQNIEIKELKKKSVENDQKLFAATRDLLRAQDSISTNLTKL